MLEFHDNRKRPQATTYIRPDMKKADRFGRPNLQLQFYGTVAGLSTEHPIGSVLPIRLSQSISKDK
jgi:hypothetical protein